MAFLTKSEKQRLAQAVAQAEAGTSGEFVTVIAGAADDYLYVPLLWAALSALALPGLISVSGIGMLIDHGYLIQIIAFFALALAFQWRPLKMRLLPRNLKYARAHRLAQEQFFVQGLRMTRERTGVLLFVSVAEHYVEIIADQGIHAVVPAGTWDQIVAQLLEEVKAGRVAEGFIAAVDACGKLLAEHFPAREDDRNELPDRLIEI